MGTGAIPLNPEANSGLSFAFLFRSLQEEADLLLISLAAVLVLGAVWPLWQTTFLFRDLFRSRILLSLAALPVAAALANSAGSRFNLDFFRITPGRGFRIDLSRKSVRFVILSFLLVVPLLVLDPVGVYAAPRSKALVPLFYVTDRATVALSSTSPAGLYNWPHERTRFVL